MKFESGLVEPPMGSERSEDGKLVSFKPSYASRKIRSNWAGKPSIAICCWQTSGLGAGIQIEFRVPGRACLVKARQKAGWSNAGLFGIKSVL
jgi:hypothetical protein